MHLWLRAISSHTCAAPIMSVLLHCFESWPLWADLLRLFLFEYRRFRSIDRFRWRNFLSDSFTRSGVLDLRGSFFRTGIESEEINVVWMFYAYTLNDCLFARGFTGQVIVGVLFWVVIPWNGVKVNDDLNQWTDSYGCHLLGWSSWNLSKQWLETIGELAQGRNHLLSFIQNAFCFIYSYLFDLPYSSCRFNASYIFVRLQWIVTWGRNRNRWILMYELKYWTELNWKLHLRFSRLNFPE